MHVAARTPLTTGVALLGASAIALAPITITPSLPSAAAPAVPVVATTPYGLTTATNPLVALGELLGNTADSVNATAVNFAQNPFPIIRQLVENQFANAAYMANAIGTMISSIPSTIEGVSTSFKAMLTAIGEGDFITAGQQMVGAIVGAFFPVAGPLYGGFQVLTHAADNMAAAVKTLANNFIPTMLAFIGPLNAFITSGAHVAQTVFDAFKEGDVGAAIGAILSAPIVQLDAVLNGFQASEFNFAPGIFTVGTNPFNTGPIAALLNLGKLIADSMTPMPPADALAAKAGTADSSSPAAVPELADTVAFTISVETDASAGEAGAAGASAETPAEAPESASIPPVDPVDETPVVDEVDEVEDGTGEEPSTPIDESEDPTLVDDDSLELTDDEADADNDGDGAGEANEAGGNEAGGNEAGGGEGAGGGGNESGGGGEA